MRIISLVILFFILSSCWPSSISFVDSGSMPEEWKQFYVTTLKNSAPNTPISYNSILTENVKDAIQNGTRLSLATKQEDAQVEIEGVIQSYSITPIAMQEGDNASQNRLSVTVKFDIYSNAPEDDEMHLVSTRFIDYPASTDLAQVESDYLEEVNKQIVQDLVNKLLSNW